MLMMSQDDYIIMTTLKLYVAGKAVPKEFLCWSLKLYLYRIVHFVFTSSVQIATDEGLYHINAEAVCLSALDLNFVFNCLKNCNQTIHVEMIGVYAYHYSVPWD